MHDSLELAYDTFSLPTAQHRAGLAGLLVLADTMRRRHMPSVPDMRMDDRGAVRVRLTPATLTAALNELYESATQEKREKKVRRRNETVVQPLRTETETVLDRRTGKETTRAVYVYADMVPRASVLQSLGIPDPWLKLWREAVWSTLRGIPQTRLPYEQRAVGANVAEATHMWKELRRWEEQVQQGRQYTTELASTLFVGAQAHNAERVRFKGRPDENFLLHFWPLVAGVGEARRVVREKEGLREKPVGFVLAVPDVTDLEGFVDDFEGGVAQLDPSMAGYRPREAVLSLPEEGGLHYLADITRMAVARGQQGAIRFSVAGIEVYLLGKAGNTIPVLAVGRVPAREGLVEQYRLIRGRYGSLVFRGQLIRNLLAGQPWYDGFDRVFNVWEQELFVGAAAGDFVRDVKRKFRTELAT